MVFSIALRIVGERGAAEEVAQDVFLELHGSLPRLESADHVRFWLRRVAVHRATDCVRRRARRPEFSAEEWLDETGWPAGDGNGISGSMASRVECMLRSLPEGLRGPLVLRYGEDLEPEEIAKILGIPVATVKSNLQRGLELLRRKAAVMLKEFVRERV